MLHTRETLDWYRDGEPMTGRGAPAAETGPVGRTDLRGLFRILRSRILFIAVTTALLVAIAVAYVMLAIPKYASSASILIDPRRRQVVNSEVVPSGLGTDMAVVQNLVQSQLEVIRSEAVLRRVVESEGLASDPDFVGDGRVDPLTAVRAAIGRLLSFGAAPAAAPAAGDPAAAALRTLGESLKVKRAQQTYVIEVSVEARSPEKAARLTQAIAEAYLADLLQVKADANRQANSWLTARLDELRDRMLAAERAVVDYKAANDIVSIEGGLVSEKQLARINEQLISARTNRAEAEARFDQARRLSAAGAGLDTIASAIGSESILKLRQQYADIAREESEQALLLGPRHPRLQAIRAQLANTRVLIDAELERVAAAAKADFEVARSREIALEKDLEAAQRQAKTSTRAEVRLRELVSEADTSRAVYTEFLSRAKETSEQDGLDTVEARIISPAAVPLRPVSPRKLIALTLALTAGLGLGIGGALMREHFSEEAARMRRRPARPQPVRRTAVGWSSLAAADRTSGNPGLPDRLATLPRLAAGGHSPLAAFTEIVNHPVGAFAAACRDLSDRLAAPFGTGGPRIVLVASARPGEGRSTVAAGLAMTAALAGERVLLVDGDTRRASLAAAINPAAAAGIADLADGRADFEEVAVHDPESGLVFAPLAASDAGPLDWSRGLAAVRVLAREARGYGLVVVDSAPVLTDASARLLADAADQVVLVSAEPAVPGRDTADAIAALHLPAGRLSGVVTIEAGK